MCGNVLGWLAIGAGVLASALWLTASLVKVRPEEGPDWSEGGLLWVEGDRSYSVGRMFIAANRWAAGVTAGAALLQAASLAAHQLGG